MQSLSSALESTVKYSTFQLCHSKLCRIPACPLLTAGIRDGDTAEQPQLCFPKVSKKILHNPCRACAWSNKNPFRTIRRILFPATKNCCLKSARLEWERSFRFFRTPDLGLLDRNLNFTALNCGLSPAQIQTQSRALHIPPGTDGTAWLLFLLFDIQIFHPKMSSLYPNTRIPGMLPLVLSL